MVQASGGFDFDIRHHPVFATAFRTCESNGSGSPLNALLYQLPDPRAVNPASSVHPRRPSRCWAFEIVVMEQEDLAIFR